MYCKKCGNEIEIDSIFCSYCGTKQLMIFASNNKIDSNDTPDHFPENIDVSLSSEKTKYNLNVEVIKTDKYDKTYKSDINATIIGIVVLILNSTLLVVARESTDEFFLVIFWVFLTIWRIIAIFWVVNIAKRQNRRTTAWGIFALFLPYPAIIIIGTRKKKLFPPDFSNLSQETQSRYLNNLTSRLARKNFLASAKYFIDKAIMIDPNNHFAYDTRGYIKFLEKDFKSSIEDYTISINMNDTFGEKFYNRAFSKYNINDIHGAIEDWKRSIELGFNLAQDALNKYSRQ